MKSQIVVGLQWGDEGKGKIIDVLAVKFDYVVRWNGGNNAGHTVVIDGIKYPLSLIPSGVMQNKKLLISQAVVINPQVMIAEIKKFKKLKLKVNLVIDYKAHVVMPYHQLLDQASELRKGKEATGSLHLGIGYCYEDRNNRAGIRMEDLVRPEIFKDKLFKILPLKTAIIKAYGLDIKLNPVDIIKEYSVYGKFLQKYLGDVSKIVSDRISKKSFLFEQAHGTMLDPVFGTYPYTVAPHTLSSFVYPAVGIPAQSLPVLGVVKAYATRVGNGPFPTEQNNEFGRIMQNTGSEIGTVSKRVRRCGWLDLAVIRYGIRLNGCTGLAVTKLDVLSKFKTIPVCTGYKLNNKLINEFPNQVSQLPKCKPEYKVLNGWNCDISTVKNYEHLPNEAKKYIEFIEHHTKTPVTHISVGAERKQLICRK